MVTLKVGGPRKRIEAEEAEQVKARWEEQIKKGDANAVVDTIDVSCRQWTADAIKVLRPFLESVAAKTTKLNLADIIAGLETSLGLEIMSLFSECFAEAKNVEMIDLSDNAMGPRALECVESILSHPNLKKLYLINCGLSAETMKSLDKALQVEGAGPGIARLHALHLDKNMIGVKGAEEVGLRLADSKCMESFSYCGCRPESAGTQHISNGLQAMVENFDGAHPLSELKLWDCSFGTGKKDEDAIHALAKALKKCPNLKLLNLRDGGDFEETATELVAQALISAGCPLQHLDLSGCCLGAEGAETLKELLGSVLGSLKVLQLETDELGDDGVEAIVAALSESSNIIEILKLDENELEEAALDTLIEANLPKLKIMTLKENMDLEDLDDKKEQLKSKFSEAQILIDDDEEEKELSAEERERVEEEISDLADQLAGL